MRSKSNDQRKGQWLINKIRFHNSKYSWLYDDGYIEHEKANIEQIIWNMENDEFDKIMERYDD
jgi:hypothetical protein